MMPPLEFGPAVELPATMAPFWPAASGSVLFVLVLWESLTWIVFADAFRSGRLPSALRALFLCRLSDALFLCAAALLFWGRFGTWSSFGRGFIPDVENDLPLRIKLLWGMRLDRVVLGGFALAMLGKLLVAMWTMRRMLSARMR